MNILETFHILWFGDKVREMRWSGHVRRHEVYVGRRMMEMDQPRRIKRGRPKRILLNAERKHASGKCKQGSCRRLSALEMDDPLRRSQMEEDKRKIISRR